MNVHVGGCKGGRGVQEMYKTELYLTTSCCPVHPRAGASPPQPVLTGSSPLLDSLEMRAGQMLDCQLSLLPVLKAFLWPWICREHNGLHMLPMEREEGEGIPKEARASLNVKASLSGNSHDKSIKAHAILSLESCLSKKAEWEYLKGQFRWEKEHRRKRHRYPYLKVWRTWQELWLQGREGVFGMGDTRNEMQEEIEKWNVVEKLKDRADGKSSHPSRTWASR